MVTVRVVLPLLLVMACARPPAALRGDFAPVTVGQALADPDARERVRWGGELIETRPERDRTCFEIVDHPLDRIARPRMVDDSAGRFVACAQGFFDPDVWSPGREVTAVGVVDGTVDGTVGDAGYRFPRLAAEQVHLWPPRDPYDRRRPAIGIGVGGWGGGVGGGVGFGF